MSNKVQPVNLSLFLLFSLSQSLPRVIPLNVGGHSFVTTLSTLTKDKDSMLAAMFSGRHELDTDSEGRYFIDRDGTYFKYILNYLRDRKQLPSADIALEVRTRPECNGDDYQCHLHPLPPPFYFVSRCIRL